MQRLQPHADDARLAVKVLGNEIYNPFGTFRAAGSFNLIREGLKTESCHRLFNLLYLGCTGER